jgi:hypothetical protein
MSEPLTRDGVPFKWGMKLYTEEGNPKQTDENTQEITSWESPQGERFWGIGLKGSGIATDVALFFSSRNAWVRDVIQNKILTINNMLSSIEWMLDEIDQENPNELLREL